MYIYLFIFKEITIRNNILNHVYFNIYINNMINHFFLC